MTLGEIAAAARERALPNNAFVLAGRLAYAHGISIGDNPIAVQRARSFYFWRAGWQAESISHECGLKNRLRPTLTRTIGELDGAYALRLLDVAIDIRMREAYGEK